MEQPLIITIVIYENREYGDVSSIGKVLFFDLFELSQQHNFCSFDNPACDFTTIGNKNFREHFHITHHHILNKPKLVSSIGAFKHALRLNETTLRVSRGSMMPSSHNLAEA